MRCCPFTRCIVFKNHSNHLSFRFIYCEFSVFFVVPVNPRVSKDNPVFNRLLVSKFNTVRKLSDFILCDASHDCQSKFTVFINGVDVVILKPHAYAPRKHLPGILDTVKCISGKTRDLFCDKHIKFPVLCIFKHFFELLTMFGLYARYAIINISFSKLPVSIAFNEFFIILGLVFNGYLLIFGICTYTSVKSNS